jgi:hypothetical protein
MFLLEGEEYLATEAEPWGRLAFELLARFQGLRWRPEKENGKKTLSSMNTTKACLKAFREAGLRDCH